MYKKWLMIILLLMIYRIMAMPVTGQLTQPLHGSNHVGMTAPITISGYSDYADTEIIVHKYARSSRHLEIGSQPYFGDFAASARSGNDALTNGQYLFNISVQPQISDWVYDCDRDAFSFTFSVWQGMTYMTRNDGSETPFVRGVKSSVYYADVNGPSSWQKETSGDDIKGGMIPQTSAPPLNYITVWVPRDVSSPNQPEVRFVTDFPDPMTTRAMDTDGEYDDFEAHQALIAHDYVVSDTHHRILAFPAGDYDLEKVICESYADICDTTAGFVEKMAPGVANGTYMIWDPNTATNLGYPRKWMTQNLVIQGCLSQSGNELVAPTIHSKPTPALNASTSTLRGTLEDGKRVPWYSQSIPFDVLSSSNFVLRDLNLSGHANETTVTGVTESASLGINTSDARDYLIIDVNSSGYQSDGIQIGCCARYDDQQGNTLQYMDHNGRIAHSTFANNGRQGLSVIAAVDLEVSYSRFISTGEYYSDDGLSMYKGHPPRSGVDIEPLFAPVGSQKCSDNGVVACMPQMTSGIRFFHSEFADNTGLEFVANYPLTTNKVSIIDSFIDQKYPSTHHTRTATLMARDSYISGVKMETKHKAFAIIMNTSFIDDLYNYPYFDLHVEKSDIYSYRHGIYVMPRIGDQLVFDQINLVGTHQVPDSLVDVRMPSISVLGRGAWEREHMMSIPRTVTLKNSYILIPKALGGYVYSPQVCRLEGAHLSGNIWQSANDFELDDGQLHCGLSSAVEVNQDQFNGHIQATSAPAVSAPYSCSYDVVTKKCKP